MYLEYLIFLMLKELNLVMMSLILLLRLMKFGMLLMMMMLVKFALLYKVIKKFMKMSLKWQVLKEVWIILVAFVY